MANRLYPDFSSREALIDSVKAAGQYIVDHASNIVGDYPSLMCGLRLSFDFSHDKALTLGINREHIVCDLDKYPQQKQLEPQYEQLQQVARDLFMAIEPMHTPCCEETCCNLGDNGWQNDCCLIDFKERLEKCGVDLVRVKL